MEACIVKVEGGNGESWKLLEWLVKVGDEVHEGERLAVLSGKGGSRLEVLAARSGKVVRLSVDRGRELKRGAEVCELEYCSHAVVFGGLCTLCGKDLSMGHFSQDGSVADRVNVAYESKLLVSQAEAEHSEEGRAQNLLEQRMLSLVLDLDHTLLHATDDQRAEAALKNDQTPPTPGTPRVSPKHHRGVHMLRLYQDSVPLYVKLRPGLGRFLRRMSELYELHIYTNGTRPYANAIAKIIDPEKNIFRGRVTSRDDFVEGSFNQKNLRRVFPCDDTMVLILDDREDVWLDESTRSIPNLIRARPYHFFKSLHDAYDRNSTVGAAAETISAAAAAAKLTATPPPPLVVSKSHEDCLPPPSKPDVECSPPAAKLHVAAPPLGDAIADGAVKMDNGQISAAAVPKVDNGETATNAPVTIKDMQLDLSSINTTSDLPPPPPPRTPATDAARETAELVQQWWKEDTKEGYHLQRLMTVLEEVHTRFFNATENGPAPRPGSKWKPPADVKEIVTAMRKEVLQGCHVAFTGVFPADNNFEQSDKWQLALRYGASCHLELTPEVTHLIVHPRRGIRTEKALTCRSDPGIFCVSPSFLEASAVDFKRASELEHAVFPPTDEELSLTLDEYRKKKAEHNQLNLSLTGTNGREETRPDGVKHNMSFDEGKRKLGGSTLVVAEEIAPNNRKDNGNETVLKRKADEILLAESERKAARCDETEGAGTNDRPM